MSTIETTPTNNATTHDIEITDRQREAIENAIERDWEIGHILACLL